MRPSFNTAGPCLVGEHYMLPPERRLGRVLELIEERKYFTLHSGRQTGKTTSAFWLVEHLNASGRHRAVWVDLQTAREQPELDRAFPVILMELDRACARDLPSLTRPTADETKALLEVPERALLGYLSAIAAASDLPLVLLFDEADGLVGPAMVSFLTQLRAGYLDRSREPFPSSVALIGLRPVRDYAVATAEGRAVAWLGTTSPFNISAEAATLGPFTADEVTELLAQHTHATGQRFEPGASERIFTLGAGHPWLTNAMADQVVARDVTDRAVSVTAAHVDAAKETIIRERRPHIDSLVARLREPRVQKILAPMIAGQVTAGDDHDHLREDRVDDEVRVVLDDRPTDLDLAHPGPSRRGSRQSPDPPKDLAHGRFEEPAAAGTLIFATVNGGTQLEARGRMVPDRDHDRRRPSSARRSAWTSSASTSVTLPSTTSATRPWISLDHACSHAGSSASSSRLSHSSSASSRRSLAESVSSSSRRAARIAMVVRSYNGRGTEPRTHVTPAAYLDLAGLPSGFLVLCDLRRDLTWHDKLSVRDIAHAGKHIRLFGC